MTGIIKTDQLQGAQSSTITVPSGNNLTVGGTLGVTGAITGTLATAAQTNITSVGTLTNFRSTGIDDNADAITLEITSSEDVIIKHGTNNSKLQFNDQSNSSGFYIQQIGSSGDPALRFFDTTVGERMRIDTSGNLLVGTTNANPAEGNVAGIGLLAGNSISVTDDGGAPIQLNRKSSDGSIAIFRKDGSSVGNIGVSGGNNPYFSASASNHGGLIFSDGGASTPQMNPISSGSTLVDNAMNIGSASYRFKDLYLSGGLKVGGTGTANTLDDYEEGTWTPTFAASGGNPSLSFGSQSGTYTKIGRYVYTTFFIQINGVSSQGSGNLRIGPLPFALSTAHGYSVENGAIFYHMAALGRTINYGTGRGIGTDQLLLTNMDSSGNAQSLNTGALTTGYVIGSYQYITDV